MAHEYMNESLAADLAAVAESLCRSTVQVRGRGPGGGSGVVWRSDGLIVTNAHVARGEAAVVETSGGNTMDAEIVARDRRLDLAALRVSNQSLVPAPIGDPDALRVGQLVLAAGNPLGVTGAVATGIIHAITPADSGRNDWIRADIRLLPGNSGGPLADVHGRVIGINSMVAGGLGLAVPSNVVEGFLRHGSSPRVGITTRPVLVGLRGERVPGLLVLEVAAGSAAEAAGIAVGDTVVGVNGRLFRRPRDLAALSIGRGEAAILDVVRGGVRIAVPLEVATPDQEAA